MFSSVPYKKVISGIQTQTVVFVTIDVTLMATQFTMKTAQKEQNLSSAADAIIQASLTAMYK